MLIGTREGDNRPPATITLGAANFGFYPMGNGLTRLQSRFLGEPKVLEGMKEKIGVAIEGEKAAELGLVTFAYEDFDWDDELRVMIEERASHSPDSSDRHGSQSALRRSRNHGNEDLRPPHGLAKLDLPAAELGR